MRGKLWFFGGVTLGFVLGARAGREAYDEITRTARKVTDSPTVQEAAGVIQEQAHRLFVESKDRASVLMSRCQQHVGGCCGRSATEATEAEPGGPRDTAGAAGVAELGETTGPADNGATGPTPASTDGTPN